MNLSQTDIEQGTDNSDRNDRPALHTSKMTVGTRDASESGYVVRESTDHAM